MQENLTLEHHHHKYLTIHKLCSHNYSLKCDTQNFELTGKNILWGIFFSPTFSWKDLSSEQLLMELLFKLSI